MSGRSQSAARPRTQLASVSSPPNNDKILPCVKSAAYASPQTESFRRTHYFFLVPIILIAPITSLDGPFRDAVGVLGRERGGGYHTPGSVDVGPVFHVRKTLTIRCPKESGVRREGSTAPSIRTKPPPPPPAPIQLVFTQNGVFFPEFRMHNFNVFLHTCECNTH